MLKKFHLVTCFKSNVCKARNLVYTHEKVSTCENTYRVPNIEEKNASAYECKFCSLLSYNFSSLANVDVVRVYFDYILISFNNC